MEDSATAGDHGRRDGRPRLDYDADVEAESGQVGGGAGTRRRSSSLPWRVRRERGEAGGGSWGGQQGGRPLPPSGLFGASPGSGFGGGVPGLRREGGGGFRFHHGPGPGRSDSLPSQSQPYYRGPHQHFSTAQTPPRSRSPPPRATAAALRVAASRFPRGRAAAAAARWEQQLQAQRQEQRQSGGGRAAAGAGAPRRRVTPAALAETYGMMSVDPALRLPSPDRRVKLLFLVLLSVVAPLQFLNGAMRRRRQRRGGGGLPVGGAGMAKVGARFGTGGGPPRTSPPPARGEARPGFDSNGDKDNDNDDDNDATATKISDGRPSAGIKWAGWGFGGGGASYSGDLGVDPLSDDPNSDPGPFARAAWLSGPPPRPTPSYARPLWTRARSRLRALGRRLFGRVGRARKTRQRKVRRFDYLDAEDVLGRLRELAERYPELCRLESAQRRFGLASEGEDGDCPWEEGVDEDGEGGPEGNLTAVVGGGCRNWILTIEDPLYNPPGNARSSLPEVFLSGSLRGDEPIGPAAIVETASLILEATACESLPRGRESLSASTLMATRGNSNSTGAAMAMAAVEDYGGPTVFDVEQDVQARSCRSELDDRGIRAPHRQWLARLASTRRIVVVPTANAYRYARGGEFQDSAIDPTFDFPFNLGGANGNGTAVGGGGRYLGRRGAIRGEEDGGVATECMRTVTARTVNELFRSHLFRVAIQFQHSSNGGDGGVVEAVGYPWGSPFYRLAAAADRRRGSIRNGNSHGSPPSSSPKSWKRREERGGYAPPDGISMEEVANALSEYGGKFVKRGGQMYGTGSINSLLGVGSEEGSVIQEGGSGGGDGQGGGGGGGTLEDWSYAGSWDTDRATRCAIDGVHGIYPSEKTTYPDGTLRAVPLAVFTGTSRRADPVALGTDEDLLTPYGAGNGHVSRNVRAALAAIDLAEPYVTILSVGRRETSGHDVTPLRPRSSAMGAAGVGAAALLLPEGTGNITVTWTVGGAVTVDSTALMMSRWDDLDPNVFDGGLTMPTKEDLDGFFERLNREYNERSGCKGDNGGGNLGARCRAGQDLVQFTPPLGPAPTRWNERAPYPDPGEYELGLTPPEAVFSADVDLSRYKDGDRLAVYAIARVDGGWAKSDGRTYRGLDPQSHLVRSRTDPDWQYEATAILGKEKSVVRGRLDWFSVPVTLTLGPPRSTGGSAAPTKGLSGADPDGDRDINVGGWIANESEPYVSEEKRHRPDQSTPEALGLLSRGVIIRALVVGVAFSALAFVCVLLREDSDGTDVCSVWVRRRRIMEERAPRADYILPKVPLDHFSGGAEREGRYFDGAEDADVGDDEAIYRGGYGRRPDDNGVDDDNADEVELPSVSVV